MKLIYFNINQQSFKDESDFIQCNNELGRDFQFIKENCTKIIELHAM